MRPISEADGNIYTIEVSYGAWEEHTEYSVFSTPFPNLALDMFDKAKSEAERAMVMLYEHAKKGNHFPSAMDLTGEHLDYMDDALAEVFLQFWHRWDGTPLLIELCKAPINRFYSAGSKTCITHAVVMRPEEHEMRHFPDEPVEELTEFEALVECIEDEFDRK